jgi:hypothetical protein
MSVECRFDAVIIGAGLMCGRTAGQRGRKVLLLDHSPRAGRKIAISGGGRCNFTNLHAAPGNYLSENPALCTSELRRFTPVDFLKLVERHGIAYHEKAVGQIFCYDRGSRIVELLLAECKAGNVAIRTDCTVRRIVKKQGFAVHTDAGTFCAPSLFVATSGLSYPQTGASGLGYAIAGQFGLAVASCRPALVPLTYRPEDRRRIAAPSGISVAATVAKGGTAFTDALLFTHRGLSGPAILQLSSYWSEGLPIAIDLLPGLRLEEAIPKWRSARHKAGLKTLQREHLPERRSHCFVQLHGADRPARQLAAHEVSALARSFHDWPILPPPGPQAGPGPRSRAAGSTPASSLQRPSNRARSPGSSSSGRSSTPRAGWGATISSGPGSPGTARGCMAEACRFPEKIGGEPVAREQRLRPRGASSSRVPCPHPAAHPTSGGPACIAHPSVRRSCCSAFAPLLTAAPRSSAAGS